MLNARTSSQGRKMFKSGTVFLFDWGDTLMHDAPDQKGRMYLWPTVEAVEGAESLLRNLSRNHLIYVATSAKDSKEVEIQLAFQRVGLDKYISGYFCKSNLGLEKNSPLFYKQIATQLNVNCRDLIMVGDTFEKDITPAIQAGCRAIYFNRDNRHVDSNIEQVHSLGELITKTA
tara:strand:- start:263 stop:784 length:522 start_codon:yes stop_codon:yes gene_type:complete